MILQREITEVAERLKVSKSTIDKDWALGHFVNGLYSDERLKDRLIFKGGTCLRKCYFEQYRFSEDLDFTVLESDFTLSYDVLNGVCKQIEDTSGIRTYIQSLKPLLSKGRPTGFQADIKFWGADHPRNKAPLPPERWQTRIKIEMIIFEEMRFEPVLRPLLHPYSDHSQLTAKPRCYVIEEVLAEKLRALIQRKYTAPRDYYDIWYLSRENADLDWSSITTAFYHKMTYKGLSFEGAKQLLDERHRRTIIANWQPTLGYQLPAERLPTALDVLDELDVLFTKIF